MVSLLSNFLTLAQVAHEYLQDNRIATSTKKSYEQSLLPLLNEYGSWTIADFTQEIIEEYLQSREVKYTTRNKILGTIKRLFVYALDQGYIIQDPAQRIKRYKPDPSQNESRTDELVKYYTPEQMKQLYLAVKHHPQLRAIATLIHESGARIAEVLGLNLEDVDWQQRKFKVRGKGNKLRTCYFGQRSEEALQAYLKLRVPYKEAVFTELNGENQPRRLNYQSLCYQWREATRGIPAFESVGFHRIRHTFAMERAQMGLELNKLRALLGHERIETVLIYAKLSSDLVQEDAQKAIAATAEKYL